MARGLIAVGALLAVAFGILLAVVFLSRDEDRVAVDNVLALELTRAIGTSDETGDRVDLRALAPFDWDRVLVVAPGTARDEISTALGTPYRGDLPYGSSGQLFVFALRDRLARFADYRGRATFDGFERPLDELPRADAVLVVRNGIVSPAAGSKRAG
jgi:hypothetical protein